MNPLQAVTSPDPYPYYASLEPFGFDDDLGMWVAADAATVTEVLNEPQLRVRPAAEPVPEGIVGTPAGDVFGQMVRMTDGTEQARLKQVLLSALGTVDPQQVRELATELTARVLESPGPVAEKLMFAVPARVVARLCGLDDGTDEQASRWIGDFVQCIPAGATAEQQQRAAAAAGRLRDLLGPRLESTGLLGELVSLATAGGWSDQAPLLANGIGLLAQTYDATAGLIGTTLLIASDHPIGPDFEAAVREVVRYDAPIQNTRRFAAAPVRIRGQVVPAGSAVLVLLAAANRDPVANPAPDLFRTGRPAPVVHTFGLGHHGCPGQEIAVAIATAVVTETLRTRPLPKMPADVHHRPSPNARIPILTW